MVNGIKLVFAAFFGSLVVAAIISPLLFSAVENLNNAADISIIKYLATKPISQYFDRTRLAFVVIICAASLKRLYKLKKYSISEIFAKKSLFFTNFLIGTCLALLFFSINLIYCRLNLKPEAISGIPKIVATCLLASSLIAIIEEFIFRGVLLNILLTSKFKLCAIFLSSIIFGITHFSSPDTANLQLNSTWSAGFILAFHSAKAMIFDINWAYFINLIALGVLLGLVMVRTTSIWSTSGLHSGIVFVIMLARKIFNITCTNQTIYFGSGRITDSLISFAILGLICFWQIATYLKHKNISWQKHQKN